MSKHLIITIPMDGNDIEDTDFEIFQREAKHPAASFNLEVGRSISEASSCVRMFQISGEYFSVKIETVEERK